MATKEQRRIWQKRWNDKNREKVRAIGRRSYQKNRELILERCRTTYSELRKITNHKSYLRQKNTPAFKKRKEKDHRLYKLRHPLRAKLAKRLSIIRQRCKNPKYKDYKYYGGRGIKCFLMTYELVYLWKRDKAHKMKSPSVDRIDPDFHYTIGNCRFIEKSLNRPRKKKHG